MSESRLDWLLKCADELSSNIEGRVSIEDIYSKFKIAINILADPSINKNTGMLKMASSGVFHVTLVQKNRRAAFSPRDRFTLAHELAHILLYEQYRWNPSKEIGKEYFDCEDYCDKFAATLLVPNRVVDNLILETAITAHRTLIDYATTYDVSPAVMAQRIIAYNGNLGFLRGVPHINAGGRQVLKVIWGFSPLSYLGLRRRHLEENNALAKVLLNRLGDIALNYQELQQFEVPNVGFAAGHKITGYARVNNNEFILSIVSVGNESKQLEIF